jgi:hypothetical protein
MYREQYGDLSRCLVGASLAGVPLSCLQPEFADAYEIARCELVQFGERFGVKAHGDVASPVLALEVGHEQFGTRAPHDRRDTIAVGELVVVRDGSAALGPSREPDDAAVSEEADVVADRGECQSERSGDVARRRRPGREEAAHDLHAVGMPYCV